MKKYKAIIYDIDGTILNTLKMNMVPLQRIIKEEIQEDYSFADVMKYASYPGMKVMKELNINNPEEVYARWVRYVNDYEEGAELYDGFLEVFQTFNQKMKQAVVSAKTKAQYQLDFVAKGLDEFMEVAILADDTIKHKPDPEPIELCLKKLNVQKEEVIYIGDAYSDYQCCIHSGIDFGFATWGGIPIQEEIHPTFTFHTPLELLRLLEEVSIS